MSKNTLEPSYSPNIVMSLCLLLATGAVAEEPPVIEEIIVTAQKRAADVQDVTLSVNVLTGDFLDQNNISSMQEMINYAPSVSFQGDEGNLGTVSMRGIGTNVFGFAEPTVSFVVDGVPLARQSQGLMDFVEIERVEILRGPQSTLFGKNASAGVISTTTRGPGEEFESRIKVLAAEDSEYNVSATVSGPLTDNLGGLLTVFYKERDGNVENHFSHSKVNSLQSSGARLRFDWQATDNIFVKLIADYQENDDECCVGILTDPTLLSPQKLAVIAPVQPSFDNDAVNQDVMPENTARTKAISATIEWDLGDHLLTSITAFNDYYGSFVLDFDSSPAPGPVFFAPDLGLVGIQEGYGGSETFSQELRIESQTDGSFEYMLGLFHFDYDTTGGFDRVWDICFAPPAAPGSDCGFVFTFPQGNRSDAQSKSTSLFVHGTYNLTDAMRLIGGARYMHEEIGYDFERISPTGFIFGPDYQISDSHSENKVTGDISLQYDLGENAMVYGKYTRGYKGQAYGLSSSFNDAQAAEQPVDGENVDSYEIGFKSMLLENRLRLNATAFLMKYENYQAQAAILDPAGNTEFRLINAGEIETKGIEVDFTALLGANLTLSGGVTYLDAQFTDFPGAPCYTGQPLGSGSGFCMDTNGDGSGDVQDLDGFQLPAAPDLKYNVSLRYDIRLDSMPFDMFVQASHVYVDEQTFALDQASTGFNDSYDITHASVGLVDKNDRYRFTFFGRNLADDTYYTNRGFFTSRPRDVERYFGATLQLSL